MPFINELPIYNERVTYENVNNDDIITFKLNNKRCFSIVIGKTPTSIKVKNLYIFVESDKIIFEISDIIDEITKNRLSFSREIYKLANIIHY